MKDQVHSPQTILLFDIHIYYLRHAANIFPRSSQNTIDSGRKYKTSEFEEKSHRKDLLMTPK